MGVEVLLDLAAAICGDRVAFRLAAADADRVVTFAEFSELAHGGASVIRESGAAHVAYVGEHGPGFAVALFAAARAGVPITPVNYRLSPEARDGLLAALPDPLVIAETFLDDARAAGTLSPAAEDTEGPAIVLFTSGTTSAPKGVVLTHANLSSYVLQTLEPGSAAPDECALVTVPPYHVAGIMAVLTNTYAGRRLAFLPRFTASDWLATVRAERVTSAMVVPTMLARITESLGDAPADVPSLRALAYGGAKMPPTVLERALAAFPDTGFTHAYGLTETSSTIAVLTPDEHRGDSARLGSVGRAVPGIELLVRLPDGSPAPASTAGDLYVRGPQVSAGYVGTGSALDADGWFATRDRARIDADGYVFVEGRTDDTIIRGGENIAPAEIEDVLVRHPAVAEAAVVGLPDEEWGEQIAAVVVPRPGVDLDTDDLRAWAHARLRGSKTPATFVVWPELPYNDLGKLLRRDVVAALRERSLQ